MLLRDERWKGCGIMGRKREWWLKVGVPLIVVCGFILLMSACGGGGSGLSAGGCCGSGCTWSGCTGGCCPCAMGCDLGCAGGQAMNMLAPYLKYIMLVVIILLIFVFVLGKIKRASVKSNYKTAKYENKMNQKLMMAGAQPQNLSKMGGGNVNSSRQHMRHFDD